MSWNTNRLLAWGTCVGQFGSKVALNVDVLDCDRAVIEFNSEIRHVATAESAVAVGMSSTVIVMHNYKNRTFSLPALTTLTGMTLDATKPDGMVQLVMLTANNSFMLWTSEHGLIQV